MQLMILTYFVQADFSKTLAIKPQLMRTVNLPPHQEQPIKKTYNDKSLVCYKANPAFIFSWLQPIVTPIWFV